MSSPSIRAWAPVLLVAGLAASQASAAPPLLDERFELPPGFHVYRAAGPELTGGSYDIAFDGEGRLLVGDGNAVRRLTDVDHDGVYDQFEVIATGLGVRGPQGLLVWDDRLYAVGGDGLQVFTSSRSGRLVHGGRLGATFNTGGDHDLHTVIRGYDGSLYLMAGNGAGIEGRRHITAPNSPMLREREASVFRLDPLGRQWECLATGGRNPPSLAMHHTGELFSFDSDMEWHVGLPWYKPVRLNHWAAGTDQGWQEVGAYPPYFIDCVPHVTAIGRGSPNWGVFYEHYQFPPRYHHAFVVCDYRWKRESDDQYATPGRLVVFFLERDGAGWKASSETLIRPKPDARDAEDRPVSFALVDLDVAPDGSLLLSDHNQGLWRIFYDPQPTPPAPPLAPKPSPLPEGRAAVLQELLRLPQPLAEWNRPRIEHLRAALRETLDVDLEAVARNRTAPVEDRLRAIQLLSGSPQQVESLAAEPEAEIRGQVAWLLGLQASPSHENVLLHLLGDPDPMVRRRAAEGLTRSDSPEVVPALIAHLNDGSRLTRAIVMNALARHPAQQWLERALAEPAPQTVMRALVAAHTSRQTVPPKSLDPALARLLAEVPRSSSAEDRLDLMRVLALFEPAVAADAGTRATVAGFLLTGFPSNDRDVRWEQVRLLGMFAVGESFGKLLALLHSEKDEVAGFHIAQSLAKLPHGWSAQEEEQAVAWFLTTQQGWFADFASKGVEFPQFWAAAVTEFTTRHSEAVLRRTAHIDPTSVLGGALIDLLASRDTAGIPLIELYRRQHTDAARARIAIAFKRAPSPAVAALVRRELAATTAPELRAALWQGLSAQPVEPESASLLALAVAAAPPEVARDCATALLKYQPGPEAGLAGACLEHLSAGTRAFSACEKLLMVMGKRDRPGFDPAARAEHPPETPVRNAAVAFWSAWFADMFGRPFVPKSAAVAARSDEEVHRFILSDASRGGTPARGALVYETLACHSCHGGGAAPGREGRLFGPDLAGVTRRLTRAEFAEALAYPSKLVADRFKAHELKKTDGTVLVGFVTERTADIVTFVEAAEVHRIPQEDVARLAPQDTSLMPAHLLNALSTEQIRDLLAFIENIGLAAQNQPGK